MLPLTASSSPYVSQVMTEWGQIIDRHNLNQKNMLLGKYPIIISALLLCCATTTGCANEIYREVDEQGRITYTDKPTARTQQIVTVDRNHRQLQEVSKVYDGDTVILKNGRHIRLLGINTPEIESRQQIAEAGGIEAKQWLQSQLQNRNKVYIEQDQEKQDKYKRQLAHLFLADGQHLNLSLVKNGLAIVSIIPPNLRYTDELVQAQQHAEQQQLGIWSMKQYRSHPVSQIADHTKGWQRFTGTPKALTKTKKYTRLIFNDKTDIRIANIHLHLFPDLQTYLNQPLEVRGWVSRSKDHYSIPVQHPSALIMQNHSKQLDYPKIAH